MSDLSDAEFAAAEERGLAVFETEPHARAVRHDTRSGMTVVELFNGCTFAFPPRRLQGLEGASEADLSAVATSPGGYGLRWDALDIDYTVGGLMAGRFGSAAFMEREKARLRAIALGQSTPRPHAA